MAAVLCENAAISAKKNIVEVQWQDGHRSRHKPAYANNSNSDSNTEGSKIFVKQRIAAYRAGRFHSCWLRFNCRCDRCRRKIVGEGNVKRTDFPDQLELDKVEVNKAKDALRIWINGDALKDHVTYMDCDWLREMCYCDQCLYKMIHERDMKVNDPSIIPRIDYKDMESDECLFRMLEDIFNVGFVVVSNVPCKEGAVAEVGEKLGPLLDNTYGKVFSVVDLGKTDHVANSTAGLPFHTDQCHYEAGPGIQILHALRFDECVEGGDSQLVDMFRVMELFRKESPVDFLVLTRVPCTFSMVDYKPTRGASRKPIIQVDYDNQIVAFAWNPGTEDTLRVHEDDVEPFYRAHKKLQAMIERQDFVSNFRLKSGDLVMFNNRRMMHARASYKSNGGVRHLQGCYINFEELRNKYVALGGKLGKTVLAPKIGNRSAI